MDDRPHVRTCDFDKAEDFIEHLWRLQLFPGSANHDAIFRGHRDARWDLKPSAYRVAGEIRLGRIYDLLTRNKHGGIGKNFVHQHAELAAISTFYRFANNQALGLPPLPSWWHQALLAPLLSLNKSSLFALLEKRHLYQWPPVEMLPIVGLAQHYGVPTRLLDWSTDCHVAAYFAAKSALRSETEEGARLAVWCTFRGVIESTNPFLDLGGLEPSYEIRLVEVPYAGNPNLAAQRGLFSVVIPRIDLTDTSALFDRTTIDEAYYAIKRDFRGNQHYDFAFGRFENVIVPFVKYTLPISEARNLMKSLQRRGFDGARLFPGYKGCEIAMEELELVEAEDDATGATR